MDRPLGPPHPGRRSAAPPARRRRGRPGALLGFAWKASFDREAFDRQSPLAPWHLALVPLATLWSLRDLRLLRWLLLVLGYALLGTTSDPRFQLPSMAVLALAGGGAIHHLAAAWPAAGRALARPAIAWGLAVILAAPGPLYALHKLGRHGPIPPATAAAREAFLARELPGYEAIGLLDRRHGGRYTAFAIGAPYLSYHTDGRLLGQHRGPFAAGRVLPLLGDAEALYRELRAMEVDYLLVVHARGRVALTRDAAFRERFRPVLRRARFELFELAAPEV